MKSVVCNVCGMAAAVACLALILNRPAGAEDQDKQQVKEVRSTVVVQAEQADTDVAEALQKTLHEKMEGVPQVIQEKIKQKLRAVKGMQPLKVEAKLKNAAEDHKQTGGQQEVTITAQACPNGDEKQICIAIAVDGDEISAKKGAKALTVTLEDGKLVLNGKPIDLPILKKSGERQIKVEVTKAESDAKKAVRRKMVFMNEDGKAQEFTFDVDVDVDHVVGGHPHAEKTTTAHAVIVVNKADKKGDEEKKGQAHSWTIQLDPKIAKGPHNALTLGPATGHSPVPHAVHFDPPQADKSHAEVTKRLKRIESELKKIRKLLEQMQKGDHEEDDDD